MNKYRIMRRLMIVLLAVFAGGTAFGQSTVGSAPTPNTVWDCDSNMWPESPSPCPEVLIKQKHAHTPLARYRHEKWDTVVDCRNRQIVLTCSPNVPVQKFNGTYYVDPIPYDPPDPTFSLGTRMPISADDEFAPSYTNIPYPFYFFGIRKEQFRLGANGLVTFCDPTLFGSGNHCAYSYSAPLPWPDGTSGGPGSDGLNRVRDAIYGVYEDTDPNATNSHHTNPSYGIYYGVQDAYPCRKIICSWNDMAQFSCNNLNCTYQIVCYEGSNIIEVHVQQRQVCTSWQNGIGLIGIQNATGQTQVANPVPSASNGSSAINGKPAAFAPTGYNTFNTSVSNVAFRFTPAGQTAMNYGWYRIREQVDTIWTQFRLDTVAVDTVWSDTVHFTLNYNVDTVWTQYRLARYEVNDTLRNADSNPDAVNDAVGYMRPMHETDDSYSCKFLTRAYVSPKTPTKYVFFLNFLNANRDQYRLADTVFVGVDTIDYLDLHKGRIDDGLPAKLDVCLGDTAVMRLDMNKLQVISHEEWSIFRISGGDTILLDGIQSDGERPNVFNNSLNVGNYQMVEAFRFHGNDTIVMDTTLLTLADYARAGDTLKTRTLNMYTSRLPNTGLQENKIDTIIIQVSADYESGCHSFDTMMVRIFPNFDTTIREGICRGESFTWNANGVTYTEPTIPATTFAELHSQPGCDSVVRLHLAVLDVSYTVDHIEDCKPITWINGKTYTTGNAATALTDTVVLKNQYNCDSVVQLDFQIHPLQAKLTSDVDHFTIDNLNAELTDISVGGNSRIWRFPNGPDQSGPTAYYTIPAEMDGANILLIESSQYGCVDTAKIYIPLNKEHFWIPNAFTPDNPAGNNLFSSVSTKTLHQEMRIYNRRGEMVFRCEGADCAWDGKDMDGNPCIQGAYVYIIRYTNEFEPNETKVLKGTVTLIR